MALTKEDLQAIRALMQEEMEPINTRLDKVDTRLDKMEIKLDGIEQRMVKAEITLENDIIPRIQLAYEGVSGINDRLDKQNKLEVKQEDHDNRIWALEQVVKAK